MSVEHIGKGYVKICVSEEELENSIAGLSQLKPILQTQACRHGGQLKAVPDTTGSIRQIFTDYGVL